MEKFGISTALLTPFDSKCQIHWPLLRSHTLDVLHHGADSVTLFGTTGEGASISRVERNQGVDELLSAGCPSSKLILGICATAVADAIEQVEDGYRRGVRSFLLLPPFYFKDCSDEGIFAWHAELFARTPSNARFVLYHIPQLTLINLGVELLNRFKSVANDRIIAVKDSSGDWQTAQKLLDSRTFPILIGDERLLHKSIPLGGFGAISGMANLYPARLKQIVNTAKQDQALSEQVTQIVAVPVIPALKHCLSVSSNQPLWEHVRPPLTPLTTAQRAGLDESGKDDNSSNDGKAVA